MVIISRDMISISILKRSFMKERLCTSLIKAGWFYVDLEIDDLAFLFETVESVCLLLDYFLVDFGVI